MNRNYVLPAIALFIIGATCGLVGQGVFVITSSSLPAGAQYAYYSGPLSASGGSGSYQWSLVSGSLPAGLSLNTSGGFISGFPSATGTTNFTLQVTDTVTKNTARKALSITVKVITINTNHTLSPGIENIVYDNVLNASGGSGYYNWSVISGSLPVGLLLNALSGRLSGTPTKPGTSNFVVQVTDTVTNNKATKALSIAVAAIIIDQDSLYAGTQNLFYSEGLNASGGSRSYAWSLISGSLPAGLSLKAATGLISGIPTAAGTSKFTVRVTDTVTRNTATRAFSLTIDVVTITTGELPDGTQTMAYNAIFEAIGGSPPYTWSIVSGSLPSGVSLKATSGAISGTPATAGTSRFTLRVTDAHANSATSLFGVTINPLITIENFYLPSGVLNAAYSVRLAATGGASPYTWSIASGSLPAGLSLNAATGVISGRTAAAGTSNFAIKITDSNSVSVTEAFSIIVNTSLNITTTSLAAATQNVPYSVTLTATGGTPPYTWSTAPVGLPTGLSLNAITGVISGTPSEADVSTFPVELVDSHSNLANTVLSIRVNLPPDAQTSTVERVE